MDQQQSIRLFIRVRQLLFQRYVIRPQLLASLRHIKRVNVHGASLLCHQLLYTCHLLVYLIRDNLPDRREQCLYIDHSSRSEHHLCVFDYDSDSGVAYGEDVDLKCVENIILSEYHHFGHVRARHL